MCGIAGIIAPSHESVIRAMTDTMVHRGPDGDGYFSDDILSLGHRRLSIIDLEGGQQPISNEDGNLQLVCNGEIYNSPELRRELQQRGHRFKTLTDVEVIVHLYEEHGPRCVEHLQGMFAFAIWDASQRRLFMARDHLGQKPLYFCIRDGDIAFASEVKAILKSNLVAPELDLEGLWHYVTLRYLAGSLHPVSGRAEVARRHRLHLARRQTRLPQVLAS